MKNKFIDEINRYIETGKVKMRSQLSIWFERLGVAGMLLTLVVCGILLTGLLLCWWNDNLDLSNNFGALWENFPLNLVILGLVLLIAIFVLIRRYDFSYKMPFIWIVMALGIVFVCLGWWSSTQPKIADLYRDQVQRWGRRAGKNYVFGTVQKLNSNQIDIETKEGVKINVRLTNSTHFSFGIPKVGETIRIVGEWRGDKFFADGVRVFHDGECGSGTRRGFRRK